MNHNACRLLREWRTTRQQSGDAFADYGEPTFARYAYNPRGEVIAAPEYLGATVTDTSPGWIHSNSKVW